MPCNDYPPIGHTEIVYRDDPDTKRLVRDQKKRLDKYARMLCATMKLLETRTKKTYAAVTTEVPELLDWWIQHKKDDAAREEAERLKAEAEAERQRLADRKKKLREEGLKKLTPEQREALGL